ncbi:hypothetical protein GF314_12940 [bacterium]|nr:hypothetical protein [bacterium]
MSRSARASGYGAYRAPDGRWRPPRTEGLARLLARAGYGARPRTSALVRDGRVTIGGEVVTDPGHPVEPDDEVRLDGEILAEAPRLYLVVHKPVGFDCQLHGRDLRSVARLLPDDAIGLEPAGRLDVRTTGILLVSNDLRWNSHVAESSELERRYEVWVSGDVKPMLLDVLRGGISLPGGAPFRPVAIDDLGREGATTRLAVVLCGEHARTIRAAFGSVRCEVTSMARTGFGPVSLGTLGRGEWRVLSDEEVGRLGPPPSKGHR